MKTLTKTHLLIDVTADGTTIRRVPVVRWELTADDATATLDLVSSTAIVGAHGDRRDVADLLARLTAMGLDMDVNEDDQHLEWMIGFSGRVWGVAPETIIDHCTNTVTPYQAA